MMLPLLQLNADWDDPEDKRWMDGLALEGRGSSTSLPQTPDRALPARLPPHLRKRFTAALGEALKGHVLPGKQLPRDAGSPLGALPLRAAPACLADLLLASMPALSSPSEHHPLHGAVGWCMQPGGLACPASQIIVLVD